MQPHSRTLTHAELRTLSKERGESQEQRHAGASWEHLEESMIAASPEKNEYDWGIRRMIGGLVTLVLTQVLK